MWRPEEEILGLVVQRANRRRRRWRWLVGSLSSSLMLLVVGFAAIAGGQSDAPRDLHMTTGTTMAPAPSRTGNSTTGPSVETSTSTRPPDTPSTTAGPPAEPSTTTGQSAVPPSPTTAASEASPTTSAVAPETSPPRECTEEEIVASAVVEKPTYHQGEWVVATGTLRHVGSTPCHSVLAMSVSWHDATGNVLFSTGRIAGCVDPCAWYPGDALTPTVCWDQVALSTGQGQVPPGSYTVRFGWSQPGAFQASASFDIVTGPLQSGRPGACG